MRVMLIVFLTVVAIASAQVMNPAAGSAATDHTVLSNLGIAASGHTGTPSRIWGADDSGAADEIEVGTGLDLTEGVLTVAYAIQSTPYVLTSASTVTVSEAWTTNRFVLDLATNVTLEVSGVDTNKAADWVLDVRMNSYTLTFGATITNLTTAANFGRTNSYQSVVGNRPIYQSITEVW